MYFYKIEEFFIEPIKGETFNVIYDTDKEGREKIVEINSQFKAMNDLLINLSQSVSKEPIEFIVQYQSGIICYYIVSNKDLSLLPMNCKLIPVEFTDEKLTELRNKNLSKGESFKFNKKVTLSGGIPLECTGNCDHNCLDTIISSFPKANFTISIYLSATNFEELNKRRELLSKCIYTTTKNTKVTKSEVNNIAKTIGKTAFGGTNKSFEEFDIQSKTQSLIYEREYYSLQRSCMSRTSIEITSDHDYISKGISDYLQHLSNSASEVEYQLLLMDSKEVTHQNLDTGVLGKAPFIPISYISSIFAFPTKPIPGIKQRNFVSFSADVKRKTENDIVLGKYKQNFLTDISVPFNINELTKHAFITGVTGSGKTTTIKYLLEQASNKKVPFLVLEPAKNEYQYIDFVATKKYNLGSKNSGLQINPFYFPEGMHIQTHIDHIKSIFVAAFPMYGPMPYILETAIYSIYRKKGWDIVTSQTVKKTDKYPSLEDLLYEIDAATEQAGYSDDLQNDVKGALKVRINSLITGAKGNMLNCTATESAKNILCEPTVISLEGIGDEQEKVFLMGLLLVSIYEYYIAKGEYKKKLQNLLVFEEAHRLLENVQSSNNPEIADMKGKAVETFNNILSEIRAYGQGIIVADQIPSKISSDVLKNTNLKIVHRLFAKDDRESIGYSMGLKEEQIIDLLHLETGTAVTFHSELDDAIKIFVPAQEKHINIEKRIDEYVEDIVEYEVADNPEFINEALNWLRTSLLLELSNDEFENITSLIAKDFGASSIDKKAMWNKLVRVFLNENKRLTDHEKSYTARFKLLDRIFENPYQEILELCKQYNQLQYRDEEEKSAPLFELFISAEQYANNFLQNNRMIEEGRFVFFTDSDYDEIIRISNVDRFLSLHRLNREDRQKIADCIICNAYIDYPWIRDQYFGTLNKEFSSSDESIVSNNLKESEIQEEKLSQWMRSQQKLCETLNTCALETTGILKNVEKFQEKSNWLHYLPLGIIAGIETIVAILLICFK